MKRPTHIYGAERDLQTDEGYQALRLCLILAAIAAATIAAWQVGKLIWKPEAAQAAEVAR